jgi:hypothetical protein
MNTPTTTDWLIVVGGLAAAVTAFATAASAYLLWRQDRRSRVFDRPIVEASEPRRDGETSVLRLTIRNTQPAMLALESIAVRRPWTFKIYAGSGTYDATAKVERYPLPRKSCYLFGEDEGSAGWLVYPEGSRRTQSGTGGDTQWVRVAVLPPPGWSSGSVTFVLRMRLSSVNSRAIKVVFRKFIQHEASTMPAASASNKD